MQMSFTLGKNEIDEAEAARLRGLLDDARKGMVAIESYLAKGHDKMAHNIARTILTKPPTARRPPAALCR